jgi:DNA-binding response OmpR family regulator
VRRLRAKLKDDAARPRFVQTIHGFGYKFARR